MILIVLVLKYVIFSFSNIKIYSKNVFVFFYWDFSRTLNDLIWHFQKCYKEGNPMIKNVNV